MKKTLINLCIGLISVLSFSAFVSDDDPFIQLLKKLDEYGKGQRLEKAYLHLDKPYYAIGDDIWFKAYVTDSKTSAPSTISHIIYVELINENDSVTKLLKLPLLGGVANGDFKLEDNLSEGNYRIRAYTQWMRNAGPSFFFDKTIKIGNSWANKVFTKTDYQFSTINNVASIKGVVRFSNKTEQPYINNLVNYDVQVDGKSVLKGKGNTDANGILNLNITTAQLEQKAAKIIATITMSDGQKITKIIPVKLYRSALDVQFFAEGGNLIEGLPCKIALKAINGNGLGENVNGTVIDNEGNEVVSFETAYLGMGNFTLTPSEGKTYSAKIKQPNGSERQFALPKVQKSGYVLAVNNSDTAKLSIKVMLSPDLLNKGELNLIAQHDGNVFVNTKVVTSKQVSTIVVSKKEFPSGIVQLTLFAPNNLPISERMIFIENKSDKIGLVSDNIKPVYGKKGSVSINISALNNNAPVQGSFSASVTNSDIVAPDLDNETNILTGLLLSPDLVGYVEKPNHYFLNDDINTRIELDNLMLTQGWRKIDWTTVSNWQQPVSSYPAEKFMNISGVVTTTNKKPVVGGKITLLSSSKGMFVTTTTTNQDGRFSFDDISFGDSIRFVVQASTKEDKKNVTIKLDKFPEQVVSQSKNTGDIEVNVNASLLNYLKESEEYFDDQNKKGFLNRTNQLKTVNIVARTKPEDLAAPNSSNLNGRGRANSVITAKDLENSTSLAQYLQGRVPGVAVSTLEDTRGYPILTKPRPADLLNPAQQPVMAVSLDGMVLRDFSLDNIEVSDVESIEVLTDVSYSAIYGLDGYFGVLVITTKQGKGRKMADIYAPGIVTFSPKGYDIPRKFYSPKYDASPDSKPDLRTTVFWEPHLVTDANGKTSINYYNTDQAGNYRIVIEGIDANGSLARKVFTYLVK